MNSISALDRFDRWVCGIYSEDERRPSDGREVIIVRRKASIGDVIASTCVADKLIGLGYDVVFQSNATNHSVLKLHSGIKRVELPDTPADVDLDGTYEQDPDRKHKHFAEMFIDRANLELGKMNINLGPAINFAPMLRKPDPKRALEVMQKHPKPWTLICPASWSFANRTVPNAIWEKAAIDIHGTKFWLGKEKAPKGIVDLKCREVDRLTEYLSVADLLISVDTGPLHMAISMGVPAIAIHQSSSPELHLSNQRDWRMIEPHLTCLNCQTELCPLDEHRPPCQDIPPAMISWAASRRLGPPRVSIVIAVYKPKAETLKRCLDCVIGQADEIILVGDNDTPEIEVPDGVKFHRLNAEHTGYSRKANFGVRQSNGRWILLLNDDVFLEEDSVDSLLELGESDPKIGVVTHRLNYPDYTIQFGGLGRPAGHVGFGHLDHKSRQCRFIKPVEQESCCGASMLVRRQAFYEAGALSESYFLYSEDADFGLAVRSKGWKIMFDPRIAGIHLEHQSTGLMGDLNPVLQTSHKIFNERWKPYFDHNPDPDRIGTFEYLKT